MPERALQPFDEMQQQGFEPKYITNIAVSSASGKCRMPERAVQLFVRFCSRGSSPTYHNCAVVSALKCRMPAGPCSSSRCRSGDSSTTDQLHRRCQRIESAGCRGKPPGVAIGCSSRDVSPS